MTTEALKAQESKDENIILSNKNEPFKTLSAAKSARAAHGWGAATHDIVQCEAGFAIRKREWNAMEEPQPAQAPAEIPAPSVAAEPIQDIIPEQPIVHIVPEQDKAVILDYRNNYAPFNTRREAEQVMINDLKLTSATHVVIPTGNGFAIAKLAGAPDKKRDEERIKQVQNERFFMVKLQPPANDNEERVAQIGVNGDILLVLRGEEVPLPQSYIEVLEHGEHDHYKFEPGKPRKSVGKIRTYPFEKGREVTREFYIEWRRKGTEQNTAHWQQRGLGTPERR